MNATEKVAVVTGANRGIGFATCRQLAKQGFQVVLTSRDQSKGKAAVDQLQAEGLQVIHHPLEVTNPVSVEQLANFMRQKFGRLEVLVNNAGVLLDYRDSDGSLFNTKIDTLRETMETNVYGPLRLSQGLVPLMQAHNSGRIVNVSSGAGQLSDMSSGYPAYRISKTALNALTRILADELKGTNILVNSVCPGWVKTDMGGANAPRTPEQGADTIVWLATLPNGGPTGGFWRNRQPIEW
ncbi:3-oxoacyl-[acyl-carrier protein] reductase [uncultured Synechococcales cyanobacterium]|uniref:3-oxoacyl-[acyl-carrier protein] reductase n=1 Tax=uncultured Synechococcales cyanobacterium TaxID=1936017 RepID=A0A6J4UVX2_9CYAN|nr:3-oxoacyl-[acyl-carrier protein] reductase [uncultured Synechococcales cyanobacterium]